METPNKVSHARVVVRCRPLLEREREAHHACKILKLDVTGSKVMVQSKDDGRAQHTSFSFDGVFGPEATQESIFRESCVDDMIQSVLRGYHATVFAYGQTGSGKTYTMEGFNYAGESDSLNPRADFTVKSEQLGIVPRTIELLYKLVAAELNGLSASRTRFRIRCSYIQIYQEKVYDLLNPSNKTALELMARGQAPAQTQAQSSGALRVRWSHRDDFYVENLFICECKDPSSMKSYFQMGARNKVMASHSMNSASSRSHCVFTIYVDAENAGNPDEVVTSKLQLVDLAGSEKLYQTQSEGHRKMEGNHINKSLLALRQVITALSVDSQGRAAPHVPYRNSKLTQILKQTLGGNSYALMIACLSPSDEYHEENLSTLDYANRARQITTCPTINEDPRMRTIRDLREEVVFMRKQLDDLQQVVVLPDGTKLLPSLSSRAVDEWAEAGVDLGEKFIEGVNMIRELLEGNRRLRNTFDTLQRERDGLLVGKTRLMEENQELREHIDSLESLPMFNILSLQGSRSSSRSASTTNLLRDNPSPSPSPHSTTTAGSVTIITTTLAKGPGVATDVRSGASSSSSNRDSPLSEFRSGASSSASSISEKYLQEARLARASGTQRPFSRDPSPSLAFVPIGHKLSGTLGGGRKTPAQ